MKFLVICLTLATLWLMWESLGAFQADAMATCQIQHSFETCLVEAGQ